MLKNRTEIINTPEHIGKEVTLFGWVDTIRDHGKVGFIDLRDKTGIVQVVFYGENYAKLKELGNEYVVKIKGSVKERNKGQNNENIPTGSVEVDPTDVEVLNTAAELPIPINTDGLDIKEETRLEYRYLDLRRPRMAANMRNRSKAAQYIRTYLHKEGFCEIETPMLTKSTPEGARDFLVPSRLHQGSFYALPQSPQQYKQLLMVAGFEKYFQFAKCFRDEDARADRAYGEFTQLDLEMSFVEQNDILDLTETMFTKMVEDLFPEKKIQQKPWPRIPYKEAIKKYGTDKPDLRKDKNDPNEMAFAWVIDFPLFAEQSEEDFFHGSGSAKFAPSHHMFTSPHPDDIKLLDTDPTKARGLQHDMVLNGFEVGGGSIRIHSAEVQSKIFDLIGFSKEQKEQFTHMLKAFTYGVPPHGGIAPGLDRFLMVLFGEPSLRELMAFPSSTKGRTAVMDAPNDVTDAQLKELGIKTV
ncbi:aspartate--tRNA ligase [bacterium]|nr:aspartate--tRNA ligase [bacterium]